VADDSRSAAGGQAKPEAPAFRVEAQARYVKAGGFEGTGSVRELSKRGLRVEAASLRLAAGERIRVSLSLMRTSLPIVLPCVVSEVFDGGFAAEFGELTARHRSSLNLALAQLRRRQLGDDETGLTILRSSGSSKKRDPV
jgi:hypothetical protein